MSNLCKKISNGYYFINKKISIAIIGIVYLINILSIRNFLLKTNKMQTNIIDYILYLFNDFYFIFFLSYTLISIFIFRLNYTHDIDNYIYIRYKNRKEWFINRILKIAFCVLAFIITILLISSVQLFTYFKGITTWTEFGNNYFPNIQLIVKSPITAVIISISLVYLYLFALSLISFTSGLFFNKSIYGFFLAIILNLTNMLVYLNRIKSLLEFTFCTNTLLIDQYNRQIDTDKIMFSLLYWSVIIIITIILGVMRIKNMDLSRGKK